HNRLEICGREVHGGSRYLSFAGHGAAFQGQGGWGRKCATATQGSLTTRSHASFGKVYRLRPYRATDGRSAPLVIACNAWRTFLQPCARVVEATWPSSMRT